MISTFGTPHPTHPHTPSPLTFHAECAQACSCKEGIRLWGGDLPLYFDVDHWACCKRCRDTLNCRQVHIRRAHALVACTCVPREKRKGKGS